MRTLAQRILPDWLSQPVGKLRRSQSCIAKETLEGLNASRVLQRLGKLPDDPPDARNIQRAAIEQKEFLRVLEISGPRGHELIDDEVFRTGQADADSSIVTFHAAPNCLLFERKPSKTKVYWHARGFVLDQEYLPFLGEGDGIADSRGDSMIPEQVEKRLRIDPEGQDGGVNVRSQAGHPCGDHRHTPDHEPGSTMLPEAIAQGLGAARPTLSPAHALSKPRPDCADGFVIGLPPWIW